jgi:hypothetical protein
VGERWRGAKRFHAIDRALVVQRVQRKEPVLDDLRALRSCEAVRRPIAAAGQIGVIEQRDGARPMELARHELHAQIRQCTRRERAQCLRARALDPECQIPLPSRAEKSVDTREVVQEVADTSAPEKCARHHALRAASERMYSRTPRPGSMNGRRYPALRRRPSAASVNG